jgi:hypothetical protein
MLCIAALAEEKLDKPVVMGEPLLEVKPCDEGCWFDSARGQYLGAAVIVAAWEHGFVCPQMDELARLRENRTLEVPTHRVWWEMIADDSAYNDIFEEAEAWFNNLAPDGFYFGTSEIGDWGLWKVESDEEGS